MGKRTPDHGYNGPMLILALLGCTGGSDLAGCADTGACPCETPSVVVGGGDVEFVALEDGDPTTIVFGAQGGWHILGAAYMTNFDPVVNIHYTVVVEATGAVVADNNYRVQMKADGDCAGFYPGMYGYLDVREIVDGEADTPPELLGGEQLRLTMDVTDLVGRAGTDSLLVVGELDPHDL